MQLTDPVDLPARTPTSFDRWLLSMLEDPRDLRIAHLIVMMSCTVLPFAAVLFFAPSFPWWLGVAYDFLVIAIFLPPFTLMLHVTSHRRLFNARFHGLRNYIPVILGPFFGQPPWAYHAHHVGMHHVEANMPADLSSTMRFQRDSLLDFARYFGRFFFLAAIELPLYFLRRKKPGLARRAFFGELSFFLLAALSAAFNPFAALFVFIIPFLTIRFLMMCGNWGQHAFVDPAEPESAYKSTITCINTPYNTRCFNDGYHISHHLKPTRHFSEHPAELLENRAEYAKNGAIVFERTDFFIVWLMLMLKRHTWLAEHMVSLDDKPMSVEEKVALIRSRLVPIPPKA